MLLILKNTTANWVVRSDRRLPNNLVILFSTQSSRGWAWEFQQGKWFQQSLLLIYNPTDLIGFPGSPARSLSFSESRCAKLFTAVQHITSSSTPRSGKRGGWYTWEFSVEVCHLILQILTLFQTKKCNFPHQTSKIHTCFQTWPLGRNYVIIT